MFIQDLDDKRNSVRADFVADVKVCTADSEVTGRLKNLSIDGMLLHTGAELEAGTPCQVAILVGSRNSRLTIDEVQGEVVRSESGEMGVKFSHPFEWLTLFHVYHSRSAQN